MADLANVADLVLLLDDLQEHLGLTEPIPDDLTEVDALTLAMAWSVLSTGQGSWPNAVLERTVTADGVIAFMEHRSGLPSPASSC
ncbi:hypothetical protein [Micromonospora sp. RL09-050-HVF-A]|uniref:hypothetical protein n=1 Tax=Micromonospora sp. RL09-050-HVF-A TaxID=1703433 RepID=UPI001C5F1E19|nr:hypothetical protein [Micromonospora sp. RL09-050-HVF-A]MBW4706156.1 hypothetical protein [Micromonospora sp. RL09-050-HVF-A]